MSIEQIDPVDLKTAMESGRALLIDVRESGEYDEAAIDGAILIPMNACHPASLPCNPDKMLVFQCRSGGRSGRVCESYHAAYPDRTIYNLAGGIQAWIAAGLPVK